MKTTQPNFEKIKTAIYQAGQKTNFMQWSILFEHCKTGKIKYSHINGEVKEIEKEFNVWLDRLDIRCVGSLIDKCKELDISLPNWIKAKNFSIDYNDNDALDLIKSN